MKFLTAITLLGTLSLLTSCDQADVEETEQISTPKMPPLTYTWSHEECPFTADFPGKPEEDVIKNDDGTIYIYPSYLGENYHYYFYCNVDIITTAENNGPYSLEEIIDNYAELYISENFVFDGIIYPIGKSPFSILNNAYKFISAKIKNGNITVQTSSIVYKYNKTLSRSTILYPSGNKNSKNGLEFFQSVKLKE